MFSILFIQPFLVNIEGVAVLHGELSHPDKTCTRTGIIPPFGLDLIHKQGKPLVAVNLSTGEISDSFLMGHGKYHIPSRAVIESTHLSVDAVESAGFLPDIRRIDQRHQDLLSPDCIHLFTNDLFYLLGRTEPKGEQGEDASSQLADKACSQQIFIPFAISTVWGFSQGFGKEFGHPHLDTSP